MARIASTVEQKKAAARRNAQQISVPRNIASVLFARLDSVEIVQTLFRAKLFNLQELAELRAVSGLAADAGIPGFIAFDQFQVPFEITEQDLIDELEQLFEAVEVFISSPEEFEEGSEWELLKAQKRLELKDIITAIELKAEAFREVLFEVKEDDEVVFDDQLSIRERRLSNFFGRMMAIREGLIPEFIDSLRTTTEFASQ